jgi:hypothetical protein
MAMTEFEKKILQEVKGINKELHELNRILKNKPGKVVINGEKVAEGMFDAAREVRMGTRSLESR